MARSSSKLTVRSNDPRMSEVLQGIDFERRELIDEPAGQGLLDLVRKPDGSLRCTACTLCERSCPVDCIDIDYCSEHPELPGDVTAETAIEQPEIDMKPFDVVIARMREGSGLIESLQSTQETYGYLPRSLLEALADELRLPLSRVCGVATFYPQFRLEPVGKYVLEVCMGPACHGAGAPLLVEALSQEMEIAAGATTKDMLFTLETVNCVGACGLAPVVRAKDGVMHGHVSPTDARKLVRRLRKLEVSS